MRVLGIDPGLTRCGWGVVDVARDRSAVLVAVGVIRTDSVTPLAVRLASVQRGIEALLADHRPQAVALERVFAQHNVRTVMGVAQVSGIALAAAANRGIEVGMHTPSEVKAAVTGYGDADKRQVGAMVARILKLDAVPRPADAADALALALCHAWRAPASAPLNAATDGSLTPAQIAWRAAESSTVRRGPAPRLRA